MGIIIRNSVFETNSSNTHSISIIGPKRPLIEKGILVPGVLKDYEVELDEDGGYLLLADTILKKIALVAHWICLLEDAPCQDLLKKWGDFFKIEIETFVPIYSVYQEYSDIFVDDYSDNYDELLDYFFELVVNPKLIIKDLNTSW